MPTLKQISCSLELGSTNTKLKEYKHTYLDGGCEVYVAVPDTDIPFHIRVTSTGYIAPGLAAYVFIDGRYQCNRNRQGLSLPTDDTSPADYEVDFKLRQKEENTVGGLFVAREWSFAQLRADKPSTSDSNFARNVGTIEVVILRCKSSDERICDATDPVNDLVWPLSVQESAPVLGAEDLLAKKPSEKAASVAASKKGSAAGSVALGGLEGLFDGAGDGPYGDRFGGTHQYSDHGQRQYRRRGASPERDRDHGDRGHRGYRQEDPDFEELGRGYVGRSSQFGNHRPHQPDDRSDYPKTHRTQPAPRKERSDFIFVEETSKQIESILQQGGDEARRHANMEKEANLHRHDPHTFPVMARAVQRKIREIETMNDEIHALYTSINACMRKMDDDDWHRTRDYLISRRLFPELGIELQTPFPTPQMSSSPAAQRTNPPAGTDQPTGRSQPGGTLWQRAQRRRRGSVDSARNPPLPSGGNAAANDIDGINKWAADSKAGGWPTVPDQSAPPEQWNDDKGNRSQHASQKNAGWGEPAKEPANNEWPTAGESNEQPQDNNSNQSDKPNDSGGNGGGWTNDQGDWGAPPAAQATPPAATGWDEPPAKHNSTSKGHDKDGADERPQRGEDTATEAGGFRPAIKSYWKTWNQPPADVRRPVARARDPYNYPPASSLGAPSGKPASVSHGVQAGRGANYAHQLSRPAYLDTMQDPYAIFTFKYRSQATLEKILDRKIDTSHAMRAVQEAEEERLMRLPKEDLVAELLKRQNLGKQASRAPSAAATGKDRNPPSAKPASKAGGWAADEVKPGDSVSQAGWQEVGKGETGGADTGWGNKSKKAESVQHWAKDDPEVKVVAW